MKNNMSLFSWLKGYENKNISETKRFIQLIEDNHKLEKDINIMYQAFCMCCDEIYKYTGKLEHLKPEYFINKWKNT